jgi:hypothetical protein
MIQNPLKLQTYNDGLVDIYEAVSPRKIAAAPKIKLRFEDRTIGVTRHYAAQQANAKIAHVLRCPRIKTVSTQDIAVLDGHQYNITFIQYPKDVTPLSMDLTLEEVRGNYAADN